MKLDSYIQQSGITESKFAERIGSTQPTVNKYRRGLMCPRPEMMKRIHEATDGAVSPSDFFDFTTTPESDLKEAS